MGPEQAKNAAGHDSLWLRVIGVGKVLKALFLLLIAVSVLRLVHTGFGSEMASLADILRYSPESNFVRWMLEKASLLSDKRLEQVAAVSGIFSLTEFVESYGLLRRRMWGEYMTFGLTCAFLPLDIYELIAHFSWRKMGFTVANALIAAYLGWHIERKRQIRRRLAEGRGSDFEV
jgi:uncharacterized membrane protein (DUF2068 family)